MFSVSQSLIKTLVLSKFGLFSRCIWAGNEEEVHVQCEEICNIHRDKSWKQ